MLSDAVDPLVLYVCLFNLQTFFNDIVHSRDLLKGKHGRLILIVFIIHLNFYSG